MLLGLQELEAPGDEHELLLMAKAVNADLFEVLPRQQIGEVCERAEVVLVAHRLLVLLQVDEAKELLDGLAGGEQARELELEVGDVQAAHVLLEEVAVGRRADPDGRQVRGRRLQQRQQVVAGVREVSIVGLQAAL